MATISDEERFTSFAVNSVFSVLVVFIGLGIYWWWMNSPDYGANRGPKVYPIVGSQPEFLRNVHRVYDWATDYIKLYPEHTIRLSRPLRGTIIATAHPANVEHMLFTNFNNYPKGEEVHYAFKDLLGNGIFNADGASWKSQRRVASFEFTTRTLREYLVEILQYETNDRLLPLLSQASKEGATIDLQDVFLRFAFDTTCLLGFGVDLGCLALSLPVVDFALSFDEATAMTMKRFFSSPSYLRIKHWLGLGEEKKMKKAVQVIDEFAYSVIRSRRSELSKVQGSCEPCRRQSKFSNAHVDLLSRFIQVADQDAEEEVNGRTQMETQKTGLLAETHAIADLYIRDILINFILAGRDTLSVALVWFFFLLSKNSGVEDTIRREIEELVRSRNTRSEALQDVHDFCRTRPGSGLRGMHDSHVHKAEMHTRPDRDVVTFSYDELRNMHYLQAALSESLRLYPPVPSDSKTALADDTFPDGTVIHRGDRVVFHPYAMGRLESIWGPDCLEFKPERWLEKGVYVPQSSFKFAVFQAGPRICLGKEMALTQMKYMAASIIGSPLRVNVDPAQDFTYDISLTLKMKDGLLVSVVDSESSA